jgi:uncharacterized membrane protein YuzA (DUF378 family)
MNFQRLSKILDVTVWTLLTIGALNWGMIGIFNINLVAMFFGETAALSRIIYTIIGLGAVYEIVGVRKIAQRWDLHYRAKTA